MKSESKALEYRHSQGVTRILVQFWPTLELFLLPFFVVLGSGSGLKMLLGPVRSFSRSRFLISSILDPFRVNFGILGRPQYCVFLQDRECSSSATRKFSPNPSYLRSGELVLPWDTKNRSSHTQIVHIDILRAQMYLKSAIWAHGPTGPTGPGPMGPWILHF